MKRKLFPIIFSSIMILSSVPSYAAVHYVSNKPAAQTAATLSELDDGILTLDEAFEKAVKYSHTLKTLDESTTLNEKKADDARRDLIIADTASDNITFSKKLKNLLNSIENNKANTQIEKEKIRLNLIETFASILKAQDDIVIYNKQLEINEKELKIANEKIKRGLMSQSEYDSLVISDKNTRNSKKNLEISLEQAYTSLNKIIGENSLTKSYTVALDIPYEPLGDVDVEYAATKAATSSQAVKDKKTAQEIAKYGKDMYHYTDEVNNGGYQESYDNQYAKATRDTADAKTTAESNVRNVYNDILKSETEYTANTETLKQKKAELDILQKQLSLGKITQLAYDKSALEIEKLENTISQSVYSHYVLVCKFNDPDLISSYYDSYSGSSDFDI